MKRIIKVLLTVIVVVLLLGVVYKVIDYNLRASATEKDISIQATLKKNDTDKYVDCDYILDVSITKNKDANIMIYPYIEDKTRFTYSEEEDSSFYIPGCVGSDGITSSLAQNELMNYINDEDEGLYSLIGFGFPDEKGTYKSRFYVNLDRQLESLQDPYLACVYLEKKLWKQITWTSVIPISVQQ